MGRVVRFVLFAGALGALGVLVLMGVWGWRTDMWIDRCADDYNNPAYITDQARREAACAGGP